MATQTHAMDLHLQQASVNTHRSQGEVREVQGATGTMVRSEDGIFVDVKTKELEPGHVYTMWFVAINDPSNCSATPCPSTDVLGSSTMVKSDLGFADGTIADLSGAAHFATFQPLGELTNAWFGNGLAQSGAEIHLVLRDHGPMQMGYERQMMSTFRGGCTDESVSDSVPDTARNDGLMGYFACSNQQTVIFLPSGVGQDS
ncbi:hypothetical protein [Ruegeria atlantica]|uniref:hypothetical protein n=1 Tax=Ruegeria atlantica TaxID=81569 RepID=UPI001480E52D|nr:hypothetical protein [Ruegeria atlantica]